MKNKNVIITGASSGIGAALAKAYAQAGWNVGLISRRAARLEAVAVACRTYGIQTVTVAADIRSPEQISSAIARIETEIGQTDICIAAAGLSVLETDLSNMEITRSVYETNLLGTLNTFHAVLPSMKNMNSGHLVAISSLAAARGLPQHGAYCGSKQALNTHCEALRSELKKNNITITIIHPGFVYTPMIEHLTPPRFLSVSAQTAAVKIKYAIDRRRRNFSFPFSAKLLAKFCRWLPSFIFEWMAKQSLKVQKVSDLL